MKTKLIYHHDSFIDRHSMPISITCSMIVAGLYMWQTAMMIIPIFRCHWDTLVFDHKCTIWTLNSIVPRHPSQCHKFSVNTKSLSRDRWWARSLSPAIARWWCFHPLCLEIWNWYISVNIWVRVSIKSSKCRKCSWPSFCYIQLPVWYSIKNLSRARNGGHFENFEILNTA